MSFGVKSSMDPLDISMSCLERGQHPTSDDNVVNTHTQNYLTLNKEGFRKILKKHEKVGG